MTNEVHYIDNMKYMATVEDNAFDLAIVDPQTGQGEDGGKNRRGVTHKKENWDNKRPSKEYFQELFRVSKNQIIWQAEYFIDYLYPSAGCICWDKKLDNSDYSDFEFAWTSFNRAKKIFRYCKIGGRNYPGRFIQPCQKPVALYKWTLQNYAKPEWKILDTHEGSGSNRIACYDMGFYHVGCENNLHNWQGQEDRYKTHIAQSGLFKTEEIQEAIYSQGSVI